MVLQDVSYQIRGSIFDVYNELGPGLLESVYEKALIIEMRCRGLKVQNQVMFEVLYKGSSLGTQQRLDILVNDQVIIEIKSVEALQPVHHKQLISYLKLTGKPLGFLVNFNTDRIRESIKRVVNDKKHPC
ncbi:PD-(D/E)XK nuclease superfamily protein [anaerobic digester metagenome]